MSQRVVAYEGEGRLRRPVYADEGPASVAVDALAAIGSISASRIRETAGNIEGQPSGGAGPVERRQITEAERSIRAEARPSPALRPVITPTHEEPAMTEPASIREPSLNGPAAALVRLSRAAQDAAAALERKTEADLAWQATQVELAAAWEAVNGTGEPPAVAPPAAAPKLVSRGNSAAQSRANGTASMLARRAAKAEPAIGGGPAVMAPFLRRMLDALVEVDGDRPAAAAKLGIKRTSLIGTLGKLRKRTDLTEQERAAIGGRAH